MFPGYHRNTNGQYDVVEYGGSNRPYYHARGHYTYDRQWNDDDGSDFIDDDQYFPVERPLSYEQPGHGNRNRNNGANRGNYKYGRQWNDDDGSDFIDDDQYFPIERPLSYEQSGHGNRNRIPRGPEHHFQPQNGQNGSRVGNTYGERWVQLKDFKCPVRGCKGQSKWYKWICAKDKTKIYLSQRGNMRCSQQQYNGRWRHFGQICQWRFDCGNHGDHPGRRFQYADFQGFSFALSHAVQLMDAAGAEWVGALCQELGVQYGRQ